MVRRAAPLLFALTLVACTKQVTLGPTDVSKLDGAPRRPAGIASSAGAESRVSSASSTTVDLKDRFDLAVRTRSGVSVTFEDPVAVGVDRAELVVSSDRRKETRFSLDDVRDVTLSQPDQVANIVIFACITAVATGALLWASHAVTTGGTNDAR